MIYARLKALRWKQRDLAAQARLPVSQVNRIIHMKGCIELTDLRNVASALGIEFARLYRALRVIEPAAIRHFGRLWHSHTRNRCPQYRAVGGELILDLGGYGAVSMIEVDGVPVIRGKCAKTGKDVDNGLYCVSGESITCKERALPSNPMSDS